MQDLNDKITGGTLTAAEWNDVPSEIQNVIEGLGITLSGSDLNQLGKAIAGYVANGTFYTDSGAADAYVLTVVGSKQKPTAYTDGFEINFVTSNPSTGGAVTVNVAGLGVKNIVLESGFNPASGQISGRVKALYDSTAGNFKLTQSGAVKVTVYTANGTHVPESGSKAIEFTATGGGGGGGGVDGQGAGTSAVTGGGGAGSTAIKTVTEVAASYTIVVGAGGAGGAAGNNSGVDGSPSTVVGAGVNISGNKGNGSAGALATAGDATNHGGTFVQATGGDINYGGGFGMTGLVVGGVLSSWGHSAGSVYGGAVRAPSAVDGLNGLAPGAGGSGVSITDDVSNRSGGAGADGIVIVREFF